MAQVEVTVIPLVIEGGRMWVEPFKCPCCDSTLIVDRMRKVTSTVPGRPQGFEIQVVAQP